MRYVVCVGALLLQSHRPQDQSTVLYANQAIGPGTAENPGHIVYAITIIRYGT